METLVSRESKIYTERSQSEVLRTLTSLTQHTHKQG